MPKEQKVQYTVESIDIDGDGIPDGDMVTKYVNGKVHSRKFVPLSKMKQISKDVNKITKKDTPKTTKPKTESSSLRSPKEAKEKIVYKNIPDVADTQKPVLIQDTTGFGQYVKAGAGMAVGSAAVNVAIDAFAGMFGDE